LYDCLIGPEQQWNELQKLTAQPAPEVLAKEPRLAAAVQLCRDRVIEVELGRGENPTAASPTVRRIQSCFGLDLLMRFFSATGSRPFAESHYGQLGRAEAFTRLIKVTYPRAEDTPEQFAARMKEANVPTERLLQLAFLAPQWLRHVELAVGWEGLREAVWWFFA